MVDLAPLASDLGPELDPTKLRELTTPRETVVRPGWKAPDGTIMDISLSVAWLEAEPPPVGKAPVVVMLHGNGCSSLEFAPMGSFLAKRGLRVLLFDLRDTGDSEWGEELLPDPAGVAAASTLRPANSDLPSGVTDGSAYAYTWDDLAEDVVFVLDHYKVAKAHILGFSSGGVIAQIFGCRYPERTASLVLCSTGLSMIEVNVEAAKQNPEFYAAFGSAMVLHGEGDTEDKYVTDKVQFLSAIVGAREALVPKTDDGDKSLAAVSPAWHSIWRAVFGETWRRGGVDVGLRGGMRMNLARDHFERTRLEQHIEQLRELRSKAIPAIVLGGRQDPMMLPEEVERLAVELGKEVHWFAAAHWFGAPRDATQFSAYVDTIAAHVGAVEAAL